MDKSNEYNSEEKIKPDRKNMNIGKTNYGTRIKN